MSYDVYLYGQTLLSSLNLLSEKYPEPDSYAEIKESYTVPGGETINVAIVLSSYGCKTKIDGPFFGAKTKDALIEYCKKFDIDYSDMHYDPTFEGVQDYVLIDKHSRTVFGKFQKYFSDGTKRWGVPQKQSIQSAKIVSIDPFFQNESVLAAELCVELSKKYVTIDCPYNEFLHRHSEVNVISNEYIRNNYPNEDVEQLLHKYTESTNGLVIFTFGSREILFGRKDSEIKKIIPYKVNVVSTLGAGDTFRAGILYAILNNFDDEKTVKYAAATAAVVCTRFPMAFNPPSLNDVNDLMQ
jgi:sugar/nucleoside kinase (ribokinase family)